MDKFRSKQTKVILLLSFFSIALTIPLVMLATLDFDHFETTYLASVYQTEHQTNLLENIEKKSGLLSNSSIAFNPCTKIGDFPCNRSLDDKNNTVCISRELHCDSHNDCKHGEDEENCVDSYGHLKNTFDKIQKITNNPDFENLFQKMLDMHLQNNCTLDEHISNQCPVKCNLLNNHHVYCRNSNVAQFPQEIKKNVTLINLDGNEIGKIPKNTFKDFSNLKIFSIKVNKLKIISDYCFNGSFELQKIYLNQNLINKIEIKAFEGLFKLREISLRVNQLRNLDLNVFTPLENLRALDLSINHLDLENQVFPHLPYLETLYLSENKIKAINKKMFFNLKNLNVICLSGNLITTIDHELFMKNTALYELRLSHNQITYIHPLTFRNNIELSSLVLNDNKIQNFDKSTFSNLTSLNSLNLAGLTINNIDLEHFSCLKNLKHIYFSHFRYCMYAPKVRVCRPFSNHLSSISNLLAFPLLKYGVWTISIVTLVANLAVLLWRTIQRRKNQSLSMLVENLAASDLMTGTYLLIIAVHDHLFSGSFNQHALYWTRSWQCTFGGFLAMFSCEMSLLIALLITVDRYRSITDPYNQITNKIPTRMLIVVWFVSLIIAVFPLVFWFVQEQNYSYYNANALCFPLHLTEPYLLGWQFSAFIFLGVNFSAVCAIVYMYSRMYFMIKRDRQHTRPVVLHSAINRKHPDSNYLFATKSGIQSEDRVLAMRFFFIVATDCLCWVPIIFFRLMAFTNMPIPETINAWLVVFILPINSALNPVIYTMAAPKQMPIALLHKLLPCKTELLGLLQPMQQISIRTSFDSGTLSQSEVKSPVESSYLAMHSQSKPLSKSQSKP